jgi:hypothetical protein
MPTAIPDATQASMLFTVTPEPEVFDFAQNWDRCRPHLNDPWLIRLLDRSMREYCRLDTRQGPWSRKKGPWYYTPTDAWACLITDKFEDAEPDWDEKHKHLWGDDKDEPSAAWWTAREEAERKYQPQPGTYEWYQAYNLGCVMCKWSAALGSLLYPELTWCTYEGASWATAVGLLPDGRVRMIFDITLFDEYSGHEILAAVEKESEHWFEPFLHAPPPR